MKKSFFYFNGEDGTRDVSRRDAPGNGNIPGKTVTDRAVRYVNDEGGAARGVGDE